MSIDPQMDMRVETYRHQTRDNIAMSDLLIIFGAPPCTVFSSMQNQKYHDTPEWQDKYEEGDHFFNFRWMCIGIRLHEGNSFYMNTQQPPPHGT